MQTTKLPVLMGSLAVMALLAGVSGTAHANPYHHGGYRGAVVYQRPVYAPPAPVYRQYQQPVYQQPVYQQYQQPVYVPPALPVYQQPVYAPPVVPVYAPPAYGHRRHYAPRPVFAPVYHHHRTWR